MGKINIRYLLIIFLITSIFHSCKKNDVDLNPDLLSEKEIFEKFTKVPEGLNPTLQKIADKLKSKNEQTPFIIEIGKKVGLPLWSNSQFSSNKNKKTAHRESEENETIIIPLSLPYSSEVSGFIEAEIDANNNVLNISEFDKFNYYLLGFDNANIGIDAEDVVVQCLILQKEIYVNATFKILDNRLFNSDDNILLRKNFEVSLSENPPNITTSSKVVIVKYNHCTNHDGLGPAQHMGSHPQYTQRVNNALTDIFNQNGGTNMTPQVAYNEVLNLTNRIKTAIIANPQLRLMI